MEPEPTIRALADGERLAFQDDFVLSHVSRVPTAATPDAILQYGIDRGGPNRLALLYVAERAGVGVPDADARSAFVALSRKSEPYYAASTLVVPVSGLAAGTAYAFVNAVRVASGGRLPFAIFADVPHALAWLRQAVPVQTRLPSDDAIERLIARVRATP